MNNDFKITKKSEVIGIAFILCLVVFGLVSNALTPKSDLSITTDILDNYTYKLEQTAKYHEEFYAAIATIDMGKPIYQVHEETKSLITMYAVSAQTGYDAALNDAGEIKNTELKSQLIDAIDSVYEANNQIYSIMKYLRDGMANGEMNQAYIGIKINFAAIELAGGMAKIEEIRKAALAADTLQRNKK